MRDFFKSRTEIRTISGEFYLETKTAFRGKGLSEITGYLNQVNDLILKTLYLTTVIETEHPELAEFLEEMKLNFTEDNTEITVKSLSEYYLSLNSVLENYIASPNTTLN